MSNPLTPVSSAASQVWNAAIRTWSPLLVAAIVGFLVNIGLPVDDGLKEGIVALVGATAGLAYYLIVFLLQKYVSPKFGWLLGSPSAPTYAKPNEKAVVVPEGSDAVVVTKDYTFVVDSKVSSEQVKEIAQKIEEIQG